MSITTINHYMVRQASHIFSSGMEKWEKTASAQIPMMNESGKSADHLGNGAQRSLELYEQTFTVEEETRNLLQKARKRKGQLTELTSRLSFCSLLENDYCL